MSATKKITLAITGSIAAYKACLIIRKLIKEGNEVQAMVTPAGKEFIGLLTLSTLTRKPVISDFFDRRDGSWHSHVNIGTWSDAMIIAPCTASTLAKMAHGVSDNMVITTYLSMKAPVFIAPAMDLDMYKHPVTQQNLAILASRGNHIIEPRSGELASGLEGKGRMAEPDDIVFAVKHILDTPLQDLKGKRIMITSGPTYEKIDPVRFIGNRSSGKTGVALADECASRGALVTLITGPTNQNTRHSNITRIDVESAEEMLQMAVREFPKCHIAILSAAVSDYRPEIYCSSKIKRGDSALTLNLVPTQDIATKLGSMKTRNQRLIGFALETNEGIENAKNKLQKKNFDLIILNNLSAENPCFNVDDNQITLISSQGERMIERKTKRELAHDIVSQISKLF